MKAVELCTFVLHTNFQLYAMSFYKVKRFSLTGRTSDSGVVKGGRGGAIAPPTASKTIFEKSLNPCRSVGGGGGTCNKNQNQS